MQMMQGLKGGPCGVTDFILRIVKFVNLPDLDLQILNTIHGQRLEYAITLGKAKARLQVCRKMIGIVLVLVSGDG